MPTPATRTTTTTQAAPVAANTVGEDNDDDNTSSIRCFSVHTHITSVITTTTPAQTRPGEERERTSGRTWYACYFFLIISYSDHPTVDNAMRRGLPLLVSISFRRTRRAYPRFHATGVVSTPPHPFSTRTDVTRGGYPFSLCFFSPRRHDERGFPLLVVFIFAQTQ